jgi:hypothetical protein
MASDTYTPFSAIIPGSPSIFEEFLLPAGLDLPGAFAHEEINRWLGILPSLERELADLKARLDTPAERAGDRVRSRTVRHELNNLWCVRALIQLEREISSAHEVRRAGSAVLA